MLRPVLIGLCLAVAPAAAGERGAPFPGPVEATLVNIVDGDTVKVDAHIWPGQTLRVSVRLRGVDAPELKSRCAAERAAAQRARDALARFLDGGPVRLADISGDKYYGRVIADLMLADGARVSALLLGSGLARPYGGKRRDGWCD